MVPSSFSYSRLSFFFFKVLNSLNTEFEFHQSSILFVQVIEIQSHALFYAEQTVAWLARKGKLNAVVTFYFAVPRAVCCSEHPFPSLLLNCFRAPGSWKCCSLQLGDWAAGLGTFIFEPVTGLFFFFFKLNLFPWGLWSHTGETVIVSTAFLVIFLCDSAGAWLLSCSTPICLVLPLRQDSKVDSQIWLNVASASFPASASMSLSYCVL